MEGRITSWAVVSEFIMTWLGVVVGLLVAPPVFWTWYEVVFGERRRRRRWFEEVRRASGERPAVLIVDLLQGKDIRAAGQRFLTGCGQLREISVDRILTIRFEYTLFFHTRRVLPAHFPPRAVLGKESGSPLPLIQASLSHLKQLAPVAYINKKPEAQQVSVTHFYC